MKKITAYKVKVSSGDPRGKFFKVDDEHCDCIDRTIFIFTDNPEDIYRAIGKDTIISVEKIGVGYSLSNVGSEK